VAAAARTSTPAAAIAGPCLGDSSRLSNAASAAVLSGLESERASAREKQERAFAAAAASAAEREEEEEEEEEEEGEGEEEEEAALPPPSLFASASIPVAAAAADAPSESLAVKNSARVCVAAWVETRASSAAA